MELPLDNPKCPQYQGIVLLGGDLLSSSVHVPYHKACPGNSGLAADVWGALGSPESLAGPPDVWEPSFCSDQDWGGGMVDES